MTANQFADYLAHFGAAEFSLRSVDRPEAAITHVASSDESAIDVIVTIRRRQRAKLETNDRGIAVMVPEMIEPVPPVPPTSSSARKSNLTPLMKDIVRSLTGQPARKAVWIAAKVQAIRNKKTACGGSFRNLLASMVRADVLEKTDDGYTLSRPDVVATP